MRAVLKIVAAAALALAVSACASVHRYEANCLNDHAQVEVGQVREIPGGFEVFGDPGPRYVTIEVSQPGAPLRPANAGDPASDYPKVSMRSFSCRPVE